jgi:hypothetical protein
MPLLKEERSIVQHTMSATKALEIIWLLPSFFFITQ